VSSYTSSSIGFPENIATGPDGALWFTNHLGNSIGRITTAGVITSYTAPTVTYPEGITAGPDGALWFTTSTAIGRITTAGSITSYSDPAIRAPTEITAGAGAIWFTDSTNFIGRITTSAASPKPVTRLWGPTRIGTAVAISTDRFPRSDSAAAVVLARSDPGQFADALVGAPLAAAKRAPLLLTPGTSLDAGTQAEIQRVAPAGSTVYLLGGPLAISPSVAAEVSALGYTVVRYGGVDRFATATQIADALGDPSTIFEATGINFPDALSAGAAAAEIHGAVLLTNDTYQASATATYLAAHPTRTRYAVGGQAAAADSGATPIVGGDRYDTAARVASAIFSGPTAFGAALGTNYPDALAGGSHIGAQGGPLLLVAATGPLPPQTQAYLSANKATITSGYLYGGSLAVGDDVLAELQGSIN
jgi:putative cell wall-binding protein